jgi:DNA-binding CsgD family transcriptional regulator
MTEVAVSIESVADAVSDVLAALNDGRSAREVGSLRLARLLGASSTAYVRFRGASRTAAVTCWPLADQRGRMDFVTDETTTAWLGPGGEWPGSIATGAWVPERRWRGSVAFTELRRLLGCRELVGVVLASTPCEARLGVFGAVERFDAEQRAALRMICVPLGRLDAQLSRLEDPARFDARTTPDPAFRPDPLDGRSGRHGLTPRELEVLRMLSLGLSARVIATRLAVSPRTVNKHLGSIYQKLECHDRLLAVRRAGALGLLPIPRPGQEAGVERVANVRMAAAAAASYDHDSVEPTGAR